MSDKKFPYSSSETPEDSYTIDYGQSLQRIFQYHTWSESITNFIWRQLPPHCRQNLQQSLGLEAASSVDYLITPLFSEEEDELVCYISFFFSDRKAYYFNALQQAVKLLPLQTDLGLREISRFALREDRNLLEQARKHDLKVKDSQLAKQRYQENTARVKRELVEKSKQREEVEDLFSLLRKSEQSLDLANLSANSVSEGHFARPVAKPEPDLTATDLMQGDHASIASASSDWFAADEGFDFSSFNPVAQSIDLVNQWEEQLSPQSISSSQANELEVYQVVKPEEPNLSAAEIQEQFNTLLQQIGSLPTRGTKSAVSPDSEAGRDLLTTAEVQALSELAQQQEQKRREIIAQQWLKDNSQDDREAKLQAATKYFQQLSQLIASDDEAEKTGLLAKSSSASHEILADPESRELSSYDLNLDLNSSLQQELKLGQVRRDYAWLQRVLQDNLLSIQAEVKQYIDELLQRFLLGLKDKFPLATAQQEVNRYFASVKLSEKFAQTDIDSINLGINSAFSQERMDNLLAEASYHQQAVGKEFWGSINDSALELKELIWQFPLESFLPSWQARGLALRLPLLCGQRLVNQRLVNQLPQAQNPSPKAKAKLELGAEAGVVELEQNLYLQSGDQKPEPISHFSLEWNLNSYLLEQFQLQLSNWESFIALVSCKQDVELLTNPKGFVSEVTKLIDKQALYTQLWQRLLSYLNLELIYVNDLRSLEDYFQLLPQTKFADLSQQMQQLAERTQQELSHTLAVVTNRVANSETQELQQAAQLWIKEELDQQQQQREQFLKDHYGIVANAKQNLSVITSSKLLLEFMLQEDLEQLQQTQQQTLTRLNTELTKERERLARFEQELTRLGQQEVDDLEQDVFVTEAKKSSLPEYLKRKVMAARDNIYRLEQEIASKEVDFVAKQSELQAQLSDLRITPLVGSQSASQAVEDLEESVNIDLTSLTDPEQIRQYLADLQQQKAEQAVKATSFPKANPTNKIDLLEQFAVVANSSEAASSAAITELIASLVASAQHSDYDLKVKQVKKSLAAGITELNQAELTTREQAILATDESPNQASLDKTKLASNLWRSLELNFNDPKLKPSLRKQLLAEREIIRQAESLGYDPKPLLQKSQQLYEQRLLKQQKWAQEMALRRKAKKAGLNYEEYLKQNPSV